MQRLTRLMSLGLLLIACNAPSPNQQQRSPDTTARTIYSCANPKTTDQAWYSAKTKAPLFKGLEGIDLDITTTSAEARQYFSQGMMLSYGFNHAEAARSFYEATRLDSNCAMCYWGYAYVLGPNYNAGMEKDHYQRAWQAAATAQSLAKNVSAKEKALIQALTARYVTPAPADRKPLDIAYADAMKKVYVQYPSDPDIGALYAEAMMDIHPWDLYDKRTKAPRPWTPELVAVLEHLMKINPRHPGAHHFYIHAMEASAHPEKALASAGLLETLVPASGHLVHMPSHIYINTGQYHKGTLSNLAAIKADSSYITACHAQGAYPLAYYPHNYHFLAATATMEGDAKLAWTAALKLRAGVETDIMRTPGWGTLQHYYTIPWFIAVQFSMWDTILAAPSPPKDLAYLVGVWHFARGMAFIGQKKVQQAITERTKLDDLAADSSLKALTIWDINTTADILAIAQKALSAEIAAEQDSLGLSVALLRQAVALEDGLNYNEPPDWFFPVRSRLKAMQTRAGR